MRKLISLVMTFFFMAIIMGGCGKASQEAAAQEPLESGIRITLDISGNPDAQAVEGAIQIVKERLDGLAVGPYYVMAQDERIIIEVPKKTDASNIAKVVSESGELQFREVLEIISPGDQLYASTQLTEVPAYNTPDHDALRSQKIVLPYVTDKGDNLKLSLGPTRLDGNIIAAADAEDDEIRGTYKINFQLTEDAAPKFAQLTTDLKGKELAIVLGYKLESYPTVNDAITGGQAEIAGNFFTQQQAQDLASILRSGALDIRFEENPTLEEF